MVFPRGGLLSPSASSAYAASSKRGDDDTSTVRTSKSSSKPNKKDRKSRENETLLLSETRRTTFSHQMGTSFGPTATSPTPDQDETFIQKLITEGLWSDKIDVVEDVLNKISNLLFTSDEELKTIRRDAIFRSGGHLAIVQAMKRHQKARGVQTQGCRALANATWETSDFMTAITGVGGIEVILVAMREFPKDEVVQICGSCAMRNLTSMRRIARLIVERDGLPVILNAMKSFPLNANIQECGCWTIAHLCLDKDNLKYIQRVKCFASIGAAADNHFKQPDVLVAARQATERLWDILVS